MSSLMPIELMYFIAGCGIDKILWDAVFIVFMHRACWRWKSELFGTDKLLGLTLIKWPQIQETKWDNCSLSPCNRAACSCPEKDGAEIENQASCETSINAGRELKLCFTADASVISVVFEMGGGWDTKAVGEFEERFLSAFIWVKSASLSKDHGVWQLRKLSTVSNSCLNKLFQLCMDTFSTTIHFPYHLNPIQGCGELFLHWPKHNGGCILRCNTVSKITLLGVDIGRL